jgi:two-component system, LytTR family, response regulator
MKCIIIDDEPLARSIIREYLQKYSDLEIVEECGDGFEGVKAIMKHKPDLIFLDIQMPKINGFEMLELVEEAPSVIFTTAFDEYAIKAFEANAIDYLLKPFSEERFDNAIKKWKHQSQTTASQPVQNLIEIATANTSEKKSRIVVKSGIDIKIIPIEEIHFFEAFDDYVKIHTKDKFYLKKKTMSFYENILPHNNFVRVHRSFIISIDQITKIEPLEKDSHIALLKSGTKIPLSRAGYARLKVVLGI